MLRQSCARVLRRVFSDHQIRIARGCERREQLDLRGCRGSWQHGHGRAEPQRRPGRQQGEQRCKGIERGKLENQPVQMPAKLECHGRERPHASEHRHLHAAIAARFVPRTEDRALRRFHRFRQAQEFFLPGEGALPQRERRRAQGFQRVEGLEMIAQALAQVLDQRKLAAAAIPGAFRAQPVPAVEALEQHCFSGQRRTRRERPGGVAAFQGESTADGDWRSVQGRASIGIRHCQSARP